MILLVAAFIMLTQLDGTPVWVDGKSVQIIRPATAQCRQMKGSGIQVGALPLCVKETPDQIREKIKEADR